MKKEDVIFLNQFINSLIETQSKIEKANISNNIEEFNKLKKIMLNLQKEIDNLLK